MVTDKSLDIAEWYLRDQELGAHFIPGLEFVDFDIYPLFEDGQLKKL
jgi:hypothetical protein